MGDSQAAQQRPRAGLSPIHIGIIGFMAWRYLFADSDDKQLQKEPGQQSNKPVVIKQEFNVFDDPRYQRDSPFLTNQKLFEPGKLEPDEFEGDHEKDSSRQEAFSQHRGQQDFSQTSDIEEIKEKEVHVRIKFDQFSEYISESAFELKNFLEDNYPQTIGNIIGVHAPLPPWVLGLNSAVSIMQMGGLFLAFAGKKVFGEENPLVKFVGANKMKCFVSVMVLNLVSSTFQFTGEFDIEVDGELLFSKLKEDRFPTGQELVDMLHDRGIDATRKPIDEGK
mmetsp:Transcript_10854/g.14111  ORF Transcript_10854/g.14111 Transcript_10854/m.14111 type:complete len:279 (+) Transcript_10854:46-882(+)|eukprot:CAMPEP_0117753388 /NCGR_PEP_ID=MMETSP0947-20121206/12191_1 /TAXON_ID=44440 /ORGANISM="Chattonella subsalsa, Strain CCMP2191" /LENGTH=278 /DNA_ID=CAMNT_0005572251 /DNA_START=16 /DNA_END=852 /DNA_ORIENTATION=-